MVTGPDNYGSAVGQTALAADELDIERLDDCYGDAILEGKEVDELPETVLCAFALNKLEIELCQPLPPMPPDEEEDDDDGAGMD